MGDSSRRQVAATGTATVGEVRRMRRDRERKIALISSVAALVLLAGFLLGRGGMLGETVSAALGYRGAGIGTRAGAGQGGVEGSGGVGGIGGAGAIGGTGGASGGSGSGGPATAGGGRAPIEKALAAKALYLTMDTAGTPSRMADTMAFVRSHEGLNAFVIDLKDNSGRVPTDPPDGIPAWIGSYDHYPALMEVLHDAGYYMIARIVCFQDPYLVEKYPDQAIRNADGSLWYDRDGRPWLNPYDQRNWDHVKDLALWAVSMGFDEVQLDYVRFPDSAQGLEKTGAVLMPGSSDYATRGAAIAAFLKYMDSALEGKAYLAADIFGFTTIAVDDMGIGQKLEEVADCVDFISPMVYPSHYYNAGIYGFDVPEAHPFEVVHKAMDQAFERTSGLKARIRPWLQDFSMRVSYGAPEVRGQITALFEHGVETFMLWNPANDYTDGVRYVE